MIAESGSYQLARIIGQQAGQRTFYTVPSGARQSMVTP